MSEDIDRIIPESAKAYRNGCVCTSASVVIGLITLAFRLGDHYTDSFDYSPVIHNLCCAIPILILLGSSTFFKDGRDLEQHENSHKEN